MTGGMDDQAMKRAVHTAIREAYKLGQDSRRHDPVQLSKALHYGESLILPMVTLRVEEAIEQAFITEKRLRADGAGEP